MHRDLEQLCHVVDEAIVMQDGAEQLLAEIREEGPLGELAPRGGPLIARFEALRDVLPASPDPAVRRWVERLDAVLHHHAWCLASALDLLAVNWRSERMREELHRIGGLGRPAEWLDALKEELDELQLD